MYSYYQKTKEKKPGLLQHPETGVDICSLPYPKDSPVVYVIKGTDLKKCIQKSKQTVLYLWSPKCQSPVCYSPNIVANKCSNIGADLFIVAEYYDSDLMSLKYSLKKPVYGIDTRYYGTDLTDKYVAKFLRDLDSTLVRSESHRYFYFVDGKFKASYRSLDSLAKYETYNIGSANN
ncbi:hypothetical protein DN068_14040 [Taibaiella soli]|uniref:Thioredoxin domain-containing protein n=1 Tax=Taibaiella soli TaxID=1649169 RepID=A0A2W2BX77_9BACT|nr:hypothetical protein DN068_14040 [Taibaiella soli]